MTKRNEKEAEWGKMITVFIIIFLNKLGHLRKFHQQLFSFQAFNAFHAKGFQYT